MKILIPPIALIKSTKTGSWNIKKLVKPVAGDDSIWTGGKFWGNLGLRQGIEDPVLQVKQMKSWVFICINYNNRAMSRQTLRLYVTKSGKDQSFKLTPTREISKDKKDYLFKLPNLTAQTSRAADIVEVLDHPFLNLMKKVNPLLNTADLMMITETYMGLTGNCYWLKRYSRLGVPYQLWVLMSQKVQPALGKTLDDYVTGYLYHQGVIPSPFDVTEIVHHKYPNPESMVLGKSPIECLSDPVKINEEIYVYERANFQNMARPDGILSTEADTPLTDTQFKRIKKEWKKTYGGAARAGEIAVLEGGLKYQQIQMTPRELNHLAGRKMTREEIAAGYGIPMALLSPDKVNLANARVAYSQYMRDSIDPKCRLLEQKINEQLIPDYKDPRLFCAFDPCIPEDKEFALKEMDMHLKHGYTIVNELRVRDGLEPHKNWGDRPIMPQNMIEFTGMPVLAGQPPAKPKGKTGENDEEMAERIAKEVYKRLTNG